MANEWKDEKDKVMPVKQWLEERRVLQAELQKLKDKLAISERTARAEAQVKVTLQTSLFKRIKIDFLLLISWLTELENRITFSGEVEVEAEDTGRRFKACA